MTELEKIAYAKSFIDKLADGINPLDDSPVPDGDIVNNVRLSRCFFYVSDILRQVIENGGVSAQKVKNQKKLPFALTDEQRSEIRISPRPITVSDIADYLNSLVDTETMTKISSSTITNWLVHLGLLEIVERADGKKSKLPTEEGRGIGIITEDRLGQYGTYRVVLYSPESQQFIYDNIEAALDLKTEQNDPLAEFHSRPWTEEHISTLTKMFQEGRTVSEMAYELKRTNGGIRARLKKLGLAE